MNNIMSYVFFYLLFVLVLGSSFAWLTNYSTDIIIIMQSTRITVSLVTAFTLFCISIFCCIMLLWLIRFAFLAPFQLHNYIKNHKKAIGYRMLIDGLFAAIAGDTQIAKCMLKQSGKLLTRYKEPLVLLLDAQVKNLEQDYTSTIQLFKAMQKDPRIQLLVLMRQFNEAIKRKDLEGAYRYATKAIKINPRLEWANCATIEKLAKEEKWDEALKVYSMMYSKQPKILTQQNILYKRVVLMTGQAISLAHKDPQKACRIALKAHVLLPSFTPTICISAKLLFKLQKIQKGTKFIENLWEKNPHPDLGMIYIHAGRQKEISAIEKFQRAKHLSRVNSNCPESQMLVALAALETGKLSLAQSLVERLVKTFPTENTFLLLAGIETVHNGDKKKINKWLIQAIQAPTDMAWIVDGIELSEWVAISPITGRLGICEWKQQTKYNRSLIQMWYALFSNINYPKYSSTKKEMQKNNISPYLLPAFSPTLVVEKRENKN